MSESGLPKCATGTHVRFSYGFMLVTLILAGWMHLATPLLAALFSYLALDRLSFARRRGKWLPLVLFFLLVAGIAYGLGYSINQAVKTLPDVADRAIPSVIQLAKEHQIELPFTDYDSLKDLALDTVKSQVHYLGSFANFARGATKQFVFLLVGIVVAVSLFLNPRLDLDRDLYPVRNNLYSVCCDEIAARFRLFYRSFATVMGAQILISAINTVLTAVFVIIVRLPDPGVIIGLTFLFGLLPVVGNLISNTVVVGIAFTVSPRMALVALVFLVVIHKLEYFLNSKIVGHRIRNPVWLTLLGLVVGETLMGVPGMILAPVVLHYIKIEASVMEVRPVPDKMGVSGFFTDES